MLEMVIKFDGKQVQVIGPIQDKMTAYALLEAARDSIQEFHRKAAETRIVEAPFIPPNIAKRNGG
jgi:hypothetical protein